MNRVSDGNQNTPISRTKSFIKHVVNDIRDINMFTEMTIYLSHMGINNLKVTK